MKLTSIKRSYYFNRVAYKSKLPQRYIYPLYTIYILQPTGFNAIEDTLKRVKRGHSGAQMTHVMNYLIANNYVNKELKRYTVTDTGLLALKDIETRLRKERHDK